MRPTTVKIYENQSTCNFQQVSKQSAEFYNSLHNRQIIRNITRKKMVSSKTHLWDPAAVLGIINETPYYQSITCVGYAPSKGRRCRKGISMENKSCITKALDGLARLGPDSPIVASKLWTIAARGLCVTFHQGQIEQVVNNWMKSIKKVAGKGKLGAKGGRTVKTNVKREFDVEHVLLDEIEEQMQDLKAKLAAFRRMKETGGPRGKGRVKKEQEKEEEDSAEEEDSDDENDSEEVEEEQEEEFKSRSKVQNRGLLGWKETEREEAKIKAQKEEQQRNAERKQKEERERQQKERQEAAEKRERAAHAERIRLKAQQAREEKARIAHEKIQKEKEEWKVSWSRYQKGWETFDPYSTSKITEGNLRASIPWPVKSGLYKDVNASSVKEFMKMAKPGNVSVRMGYSKWHPDKYNRWTRRAELTEVDWIMLDMIAKHMSFLLGEARGV